MPDFDPGDFFVTDYDACREDFVARAAQLAADPRALRRFDIVDDALSGNLSCDALWLGAPDAPRALVLMSGTHGVEGYTGSAIQRYLLQQIADGGLRLPPSLALLMVHSLNPWGMRWARRCDREGIDLNRNFCDFDALPPVTADREQVLLALSLPGTNDCIKSLAALRREWGQWRFDIAVSEGQYDTPWAPFYGGRGPAASRRAIDGCIDHWQLEQRELVVIDLHTGLGPWGYGELISDHPAGSKANDYARNLFGPAVAVAEEGQSFSVPKRGLLDYRWHPLMAERGCFLTLEFGTLSTDSLFYTLLDEHRFWRDHSPQSAPVEYARHRREMLQHFCPEDNLWRQGVLFRAWQVVRRVIGAAA